MRPTPEQLTRLPRWAVRYIEQLETHLTTEMARTRVGWVEERSEFCVSRLDTSPLRVPTGGIEELHYPLDDYDTIRIGKLDIRERDGKVEVISPHLGLTVMPVASNCVHMEMK